MYRIVFLMLSSLFFLKCGDKKEPPFMLPYYNEPGFTPIFIENKNQATVKIKHTISDFSFVDQDSNIISQQTITGKIHVANFIFTKCGSICPAMTTNMKLVSDSLQNSNDVVFLSYSVTPWLDSPAILKKYKNTKNIQNKNWHFLTGSKAAIYTLARRSYFAEEDLGFTKDSSEFLHTEHFILVDKNRKIRGIYNGTLVLEMQQLMEDINILRQEL